MAKLKPAGFLAQLGSVFFPRRLTAEVRTETLESGQVQVTPVFTVEGNEVPSHMVGASPNQSILGYNVAMDGIAGLVFKETQGKPTKLSKKKAAEFLRSLNRSGVSVRTKDGKVEPRIQDVKPDVSLVLNPDDSLAIESELVAPNGIVVDKPDDLTALKQEDGWYAVGDDFMRVATTNTPMDRLLIEAGGNQTITGEAVPLFIQGIQEQAKNLGTVEKNDPLKNLSVFSGTPEHQIKVDGDKDSIRVSTALVLNGPQGRKYEQSVADISQHENQGGGFKRVTEGWIEVKPETISQFRHASKELADRFGDHSEIRGNNIPIVLSQILRAPLKDSSWKGPWTVYFSKAVQDAHRIIEWHAEVEFKLNIVESDGRSLLELDPIYNHERFRLSHRETEAAVDAGEEWIRRRDAWIKVDTDKFKKIEDGIESLRLQPGPNGFTFPASQREHVIEVFSLLGSIQHSESYADFLAKLADFEKIETVPLPASLRPEIRFRTYQQHGYNWLAFLHRFGLNGILADDMGLGKTLQTLAMVQRAKETSGSGFPTLIICPTSVVNNWKSEVQKFFRDVSVIVYTGSNREGRLQRLHDILNLTKHGLSAPYVVTSYDIARRDHEKLNRFSWLYVVVDEGHNIKNPSAERSKAIKTINGQHKLALTGTPIQNSLEELWSLFDFAMPGYLGTRTDFKERYSRNGQVNWNAVRSGATNLKERIHPFVMRRLKEHVAKDLPPKIVIDQKVELSPIQVRLYKQVIQSTEYKKMVEEIDQKGVGRARPYILAALTKLRAICNHPVLADSQRVPGSAKYDDSGKLECLKELMEEVVEGEHRTLLFSQSTQMLDIIEDLFNKWDVKTLRLDGATAANKRSVLVDEFNGNTSIHCFLISTKAGGTGLNLTGADTVIFYDHDWNPANDSQAQDRAYRIGQTKPVTVYRLISKGTIEEKIIERQGIKKSLADEIIGEDNEGFKDLTRDELLGLFKLDEDADD